MCSLIFQVDGVVVSLGTGQSSPNPILLANLELSCNEQVEEKIARLEKHQARDRASSEYKKLCSVYWWGVRASTSAVHNEWVELELPRTWGLSCNSSFVGNYPTSTFPLGFFV